MLEQRCWKCGNPIPKDELDGQTRRYCESCYSEYSEEYKPIVAQYSILKNRVMFERAMRIMERAEADMTRYKKFANAVMKHSRDNPEQYLSADEMIAAIVLLEAGHDLRMNFSVCGYRVDILIPDMKIALEIDGERHKYKKAEDGKRDVEIRNFLGKAWEIIRIPTKYIETNPEKLPDAIKAMYDLKKETREKNGGILPETYSKREKMYYEKNTLTNTRRSHII
jgi:very-short-patch-repair endonuclease